MLIMLKNLPKDTYKHDMEKLITPCVKGRFWQKSGALRSIRLFKLADTKNTVSEYLCIGEVIPGDVGKRVVKQLNGNEALGVRLLAKEYIVRSWRNDPRLNGANPMAGKTDRRTRDRRRPGLIMMPHHG